MFAKIFKNIEIKIACVVIAAALWLYSWQAEKPPTLRASPLPQTGQQWYVNSVRIEDVPVSIVGGSGEIKLARDKVTITVKIPAQISVQGMTSIKAEIKADRIGKEDESVELFDTDFLLPEGMILLFVEPRKIDLIRR
jgi:YbbR domain-containing protein